MVNNKDIKEEFELFSDIWNMFKKNLPVGTKDNEEYWNGVVFESEEIIRKYQSELSKRLVFAMIDELEERSKVNEVS